MRFVAENHSLVVCQDECNQSPLFQNVLMADREELLQLAEFQTFSTGRTILREGDFDRSLWIILSGRCVVVKLLKSGAEQQLSLLKPGAIFGEMSFFDPAPHGASIRALDTVEAVRFSRDTYEQLLVSEPRIARQLASNVSRIMAERLRRMNSYTFDVFERLSSTSRSLQRLREENEGRAREREADERMQKDRELAQAFQENQRKLRKRRLWIACILILAVGSCMIWGWQRHWLDSSWLQYF